MDHRDHFQLGISAEMLDADDEVRFGEIGLGRLEDAGISYRFFENDYIVKPEQIAGFDAVVPVHEQYTRDLLQESPRLMAIVSFGVGFDNVDVAACTDSDVLLCHQRGVANNAMAESIVCWMLSLAHRAPEKDRLARERNWSEAGSYNGFELRDRIVGLVGLGGIGTRLVEMLQGFGMQQPIAFDPYVDGARATQCGVRMVALDELMQTADFVCVCCPLNDETRDLIGQAELRMMRPSACLINTSRGGIVNEAVLAGALTEQRIAGAAVDVWVDELPPDDHPYLGLDNLILAPHCIGWTHELFRDIGHMAFGKAIELAEGKVPEHVINPDVFKRPGFCRKLEKFQS